VEERLQPGPPANVGGRCTKVQEKIQENMAPIGRPETSSNIWKYVRHTNEVPENESEEDCVGGTSERSNKKRARNLKKVVHLRRTRYYGSIGRGGKAPANFEKENN
jgi:hypothetical protein